MSLVSWAMWTSLAWLMKLQQWLLVLELTLLRYVSKSDLDVSEDLLLF